MGDRLDDPADLAEAVRIAKATRRPLAEILEEIRGRAQRAARAEYLAGGAANEGVEWYPGRWRIADPPPPKVDC